MKINWSIWDDMRRMQNEMDRMFSSFWEPSNERLLLAGPSTKSKELATAYRTPLTDVWETENNVVATLELPGINKEDININVTDDTMEIKVEKKRDIEKEDKEKGTYRRERSYSGFYRSFSLPANVKADQAEATYKNGVLEVQVQKSEEQKKEAKKIEVK